MFLSAMAPLCVLTVTQTSLRVLGRQSLQVALSLAYKLEKHSFLCFGNLRNKAPLREVLRRQSRLIALAATLFGETLHIQEMLEKLFETTVPVKFEQDNEAVIRIIQNKYSVKLRHCNRVHRVNIASISDLLEKEESLDLRYCHTRQQLANALTKILPPIQWSEALDQLCVRPFG